TGHLANAAKLRAHKLPIPDIDGLRVPAILSIRASGPKVETGRVMHAGSSVLVRVSPRVRTEHLDVRAAPSFLIARRSFHEHLQSFIGRGVAVHVDVAPF